MIKARDDKKYIDEKYDMEWGKISTEKPEIISVPGDHITMLLPPNVNQLAKHFSNILSEFNTVSID